MYNTCMNAALVFTAGAGLGYGIERGEWVITIACAALALACLGLLHLQRRADQASSHREAYVTGKADGIITALHEQEASQ